MTQESKPLDISIMGRDFKVACTDAERPDLLRAVEYLDRKMRDIRDAGKVVGIERIAVMAALNIAHELLRTEVTGGVDLGDLKRKIGTMQASIDAAMTTQDKLF